MIQIKSFHESKYVGLILFSNYFFARMKTQVQVSDIISDYNFQYWTKSLEVNLFLYNIINLFQRETKFVLFLLIRFFDSWVQIIGLTFFFLSNYVCSNSKLLILLQITIFHNVLYFILVVSFILNSFISKY